MVRRISLDHPSARTLEAGQQEEIVDPFARNVGGITQSFADTADRPRVAKSVCSELGLNRTIRRRIEVAADQDPRGAAHGVLHDSLNRLDFLKPPSVLAGGVDVRIEEVEPAKWSV